MIKKIYRLKERDVKKVLKRWKPFFSYWIVLNQIKNKLDFNRFSIVIWSKSVNTNVTRNFFRRRFYDIAINNISINNEENGHDYTFVVKKQTKLNMKNEESLYNYIKDINFLLNKTKNKWKK